jgi:hypothetical protein
MAIGGIPSIQKLAFAFDSKRHAVLLVCGDKSGVSEKRFYKELIKRTDKRFDSHLLKLKMEVNDA